MTTPCLILAAILAAANVTTEDCSQPVGPGTPRRNDYATLFRYAPAFSFKTLPGAAKYRFTVTGPAGAAFEAESPEAPLTPVWRSLPAAPGYRLRCEGLDASGKVLGVSGERAFTKTAPFTGRYAPAARPYREAALGIYRYMTGLPAMKTLLETGEIEPTYQHNAYVSKTHSAHILAMMRWAQVDPANRDKALAFAKASAEYLLAELEPADAPLAFWPPTYTRKPLAYDPKKHGPANRPAMSGNDPHGAAKYRGEVMTVYPANVATAFVKYYGLTGEKKYLDAAKGIAKTYLKLRRPDGAWPLKYVLATGKPIGSNILVPTCPMVMFETLADATGEKVWRDAADLCYAWMEKGPLTDWNWDGQFEDINPQPPYMDPTKHNAIECLFELLKRKGDDSAALVKARELLRWSEDQFVFWESPAKGAIPSPGEAMARGGTFDPSRWHYPSVYEQYSCYISIDASASKMIRAYLVMYRAEGNALDLAKAKALADAITQVQEPSGRVPTFWAGTGDWIGEVRYDWLNCMAASAAALLEVAEAEENAALVSRLKLTKRAWRKGNRLFVDVPAGTNRSAHGSVPFDIAKFDGKGIRASVRARGWRLTPTLQTWEGFKFMMPYADEKTGAKIYPGVQQKLGDFGWQTFHLTDGNADAKRREGSFTLGIQSGTGRLEFDLASLKVETMPRLWPVTNETLRCVYTDRVRDAPVRRGVMLGHGLKEKDFADLEAWGVTLARFQMTRDWNTVGGNRDLPDYDRYIDRCLDDLENHLVWAKRHGIQIVVDLHAAPGSRDGRKDEYMFHNPVYAEHFIKTWRRIATRFKGRPEIFGFDLINEPQQTSEAAPGCDYWTLQSRAAEAIRAIDPETPIMIESNMYDPPTTFSYMMPLNLTNIIYQTHMYVPGGYTHQGVHNRKGDIVAYPNAKAKYDKEFLRKALQPVRDFQLKHGARIYVGEFSAIVWAPGAGDYIRDCIDIFEGYGWDWTFHAFREWNGWSVEHEATPENRNPVPSADNPRKRALLDGFRRGIRKPAGASTVGALGGISLDVPKAEPAEVCAEPGLKAVWIEGEPCDGKPTKFFAYYGIPEGAGAARPVPGMVLIHGGVGTAYANWVRTWVKRGYAAIAADNCGAIPKKVEGSKWDWTASGVGGPRGWGRTDLADRPPHEQWPYHAVATAIRSHSFLRSLPEVDAERTGVTGISWGGFLTMLTAGADSRFKFAAPVYACACYEGTNCRRSCKDERQWQKWHALWDPRQYVRQTRMPVVWSASTTDFFFPFDCLQRGFDELSAQPQLAIRVGMTHSHGPAGENVPEIFQMADRVLRAGRETPCVKTFAVRDGRVQAVFDLKGRKARGYDLCWTVSDGDWRNRKWEVRRTLSASSEYSAELPAETRAAFVNLVLDEPTGEPFYPETVVSTKAWFGPDKATR